MREISVYEISALIKISTLKKQLELELELATYFSKIAAALVSISKLRPWLRNIHLRQAMLWVLLCAAAQPQLAYCADYDTRADVRAFVDEMVAKYQFDRARLTSLFAAAQKKQSILDAISRPAEKVKPWHEYRAIFITEPRITHGVLLDKEFLKVIQHIHEGSSGHVISEFPTNFLQ